MINDKELIGKTEKQVAKILEGTSWRVREIDGVPQKRKLDVDMRRRNLYLKDGSVSEVTYG